MALPTRVSREQQQAQVPMVHPIELMHREFDDLLSRFFGGGLFGPSTAGALPANFGTLAAFGAGYGVDVREDDRHIHIDADVPGFRKEEVDISVENQTLTISAEHREEKTEPAQQQKQKQQAGEEQKGQYLLRERRYEKFMRSFTLPVDVDTQNVQAKLENGVLHITLNKSQESKRKKIQVS